MAFNVYHFEIFNKLGRKFLVKKKWLLLGDRYVNHVREGGGSKCFSLCVGGGDWASEKLSGRVQLEVHLPRWRVLQNFSFQPCMPNSV